MGEGSDLAKNIGSSVVGSVIGNKAADKMHLGGVGHIVAGVGGSILANDAEHKAEEEAKK